MLRRDLVLVSFLLANSFIWYYTVRAWLIQVTNNITIDENMLVNGVFFAAVIVSSLFGAVLSKRADKMRILGAWFFSGCIASIIPLLLSASSGIGVPLVALLFGLSFGIGMPACLTLFSDSTGFEQRGIAGGATLLVTNLVVVVFAFLSSDLTSIIIISIVWRVVGLSVFLLLKTGKVELPKEEKVHSFKLVFQNRTFTLYAIPWLIFSLVDRFTRIYAEKLFEQQVFEFNRLAEPIVGIAFVFLGGLLADYIGRKRVVMYGFVALGIGYAFIGLAPYLDVSRYFYTFVDGIAWGIFMVVYMLILWGDITPSRQVSEFYYAVGSIPFFFSDLLALFFRQYIQGISQASAYAIFSIASFFLFLAVLPLMYAPETLPEKQIRERELKGYVEKAKKAAEKYT
jgi:MFS family permease